MSKAFTREDEGEPAPLVSPRAPLPDGVPNYVTARGLARLEAELAELDGEIATAQQRGFAFKYPELESALRAALDH